MIRRWLIEVIREAIEEPTPPWKPTSRFLEQTSDFQTRGFGPEFMRQALQAQQDSMRIRGMCS